MIQLLTKPKKKIIIWALFDDATRSYYHALKDFDDVEIWSIGINDLNEPNYKRIDISITNPNLLESFNQLPPPDVILASPPCEGWSNADNQRRGLKSLDNSELEDQDLIMRLRSHHWYKQPNNPFLMGSMRRDFFKQHATRLVGENTALATIKLITIYSPKCWVIENPQTSLIWKYLFHFGAFNGLVNKARYNTYDLDFPPKPTVFLSNVDLKLNATVVETKKRLEDVCGYADRSAIPKSLIHAIYKRLVEYLGR